MIQNQTRRKLWAHLRRHGSHWLVVAFLTIAGLYLSFYIDSKNLWIDLRYAATQKMFLQVRRPLYPKRTAIVLIGDDEYWKGELAGRSPIRRDYLARLVEALNTAGVELIALDFDLRAPEPNASTHENPAYLEETKMLAKTINDMKGRPKIVLPTSIGIAASGDGYAAQGNVYDGLISAPIERGYVQLPYDVRRIPLPLEIEGISGDGIVTVDSFATAIVKSVDLEAYRRTAEQGSDELPFASYIAPREFTDLPEPKVLSASELLRSPEAASKYLAGKITIVSGDWNSRAYGAGPRIDSHASPVGVVPGAMIHANYVEAMLSDRVFRPIPEWIVVAGEVCVVWLLAIIALLDLPLTTQMAAMLGTTLLILLVSFFLQDLGRFVDFFIPLVIVLCHRAVEKVLEWRTEARHWRKSRAGQRNHAHTI